MSLRVSQWASMHKTTILKLKRLNFIIYTCLSFCENVKYNFPEKALLFGVKPTTLNQWILCVQFVFVKLSQPLLKYKRIGQAKFPLPPLSWQTTKPCLTADTLTVWLLCWVSASVSSWSISSPTVLKYGQTQDFFTLLLSNSRYTYLILAHKLMRHWPNHCFII